MARKRKGRAINGILLLDKPTGGSSNQILQKVRWLFKAAKAGHTGALDPLASGMLPICLGEATKFSQFLLDAEKTYEVTMHLGVRTSTSDADGEVVETKPVKVTEQAVRQVCAGFLGNSKQIPSMFSALKYQGKPLYYYARQGITIEREARDITIFELEIVRIDFPNVDMRVRCSKGTYIRSLVDDIGQLLGCGAYVTRLHRTQVADYPADNMISLAELIAIQTSLDEGVFAPLDKLLLPMDTAVLSLPAVTLSAQQQHRFEHGQSVTGESKDAITVNTMYRVYGESQSQPVFLGVGEGVVAPKDQPDTDCNTVFVSPRRRVVYEVGQG
ncbi:tRNA pseudouridine(55) synthase TruB [Aestuariibacter sp. A3R04]|uniref:tRNA pseudouridine(55) synthase TruB n=1 Tax=Aestuariibacter sp. A3R04 TaxID=2841571 RepID=UPI001C08BD1E|nr:tRNA pseudouridine(55) synthase TruB [Aestuariibacter sp. A3R04]MBU3023176.1 tRNA pseudouridine(55) synthase TruB [Aestuariibacter sp. A3R04]